MVGDSMRNVRASEVAAWTAGRVTLGKDPTCEGCGEPICQQTAFATDLGWMCGVCKAPEEWAEGIVSAWPTVADCVVECWPDQAVILPAWRIDDWYLLARRGVGLSPGHVARELGGLVHGRYTLPGEGDGAPQTPALDHDLGGES